RDARAARARAGARARRAPRRRSPRGVPHRRWPRRALRARPRAPPASGPGPPPRAARGGSLALLREVVVADLVAAGLVEAVALAARLALGRVGRHDFQQPFEALEVRRALAPEVEQQLAARRRGRGR